MVGGERAQRRPQSAPILSEDRLEDQIALLFTFGNNPIIEPLEDQSLRPQTFTDGDAYATAIRQADVDLMMLRPKHRSWKLSHCELGDAHLQQGESGGGLICNGLSPASGTILFVPLSNARDHSANGQTLDAASVTVLRPNTEFHLAIRSPHDWCSIYLPDEIPASADGTSSQRSADQHRKQPGCQVVSVSTSAVSHLRQLIVELIDVMQRHTDRLEGAEARQHAVSQIRECASPFLRSPATMPAAVVGRPELSREEIIRRVMIEIDARDDSPLSVSDLALAAQVSERTLRSVFQEYLGICPVRFLKVRQLHRVRQQLQRSGLHGDRSVGSVLSSFGIWQFGRFAAEYRGVFGELPSETLSRSRK